MKSIRAALLSIALAPLLSEGAFLDDLAAKSNRTQESPFATGGDIILKISSREYVHIFTNVNTVSTFQLNERSIARILCVGGGGPGGNYHTGYVLHGGGGGAGGFVEREDVKLAAGTYSIVVGKGGVPSAHSVVNDSGDESAVMRGETDIVRAHGGGGGGSPYSWSALGDYKTDARCGRDGASGGGSCSWDYGDNKDGGKGGKAVWGAEGNRGGLAKGAKEGGKNEYGAGGGGAGEVGYHNYDTTYPGKGGDGRSCDITGDELWYAGGGAGGFAGSQNMSIAGGRGGGGSVEIRSQKIIETAAVRGTGGGGYGGTMVSMGEKKAGNGADGIVIVRVVRAAEGFKVIVR